MGPGFFVGFKANVRGFLLTFGKIEITINRKINMDF